MTVMMYRVSTQLGHLVLLSTNPGPGMSTVPNEWLAIAGLQNGQNHLTCLAGGIPEDGRRVSTGALPASIGNVFPIWISLYGVHIDVRSRHGVDLGGMGDPFIPHPLFPTIISK